jgi:hypothetical protein
MRQRQRWPRNRRLLSALLTVALGWCAPPVASNLAGETPALISPDQARRDAWQGFAAQLPLYPAPLRQAGEGTAAAEPLLVERLDRPADFYYIVPFARQGRTTLVVLVDARSGRFKEAAHRSEDRPYPSVNAAQARSILLRVLRDPADRQAAERSRPALVWKPCEPTQSPYEPLWRFQIGTRSWYVDQLGRPLDRLDDLTMKGGGPPGHRGPGGSPP